jgi:hypothetical protein
MINLQVRPEALNIDPVQTAVIIVDMQTAFVKFYIHATGMKVSR